MPGLRVRALSEPALTHLVSPTHAPRGGSAFEGWGEMRLFMKNLAASFTLSLKSRGFESRAQRVGAEPQD